MLRIHAPQELAFVKPEGEGMIRLPRPGLPRGFLTSQHDRKPIKVGDHAPIDGLIKGEQPGLVAEELAHLDITVTGDAITIKGETKNEEEQKGRNYYRRELKYGTFVRTLPFFAEVKTTDAKAAYKDGVLEVKVPKTERAKATSVKVKID